MAAVVVWVAGLGTLFGFLASTPGAKVHASPAAGRPVTLPYAAFLADVARGSVRSVEIQQGSGLLEGVLRHGGDFTTQGPAAGLPAADIALLDRHGVARDYAAPASDTLVPLLGWLVPVGLVVLLWAWMARRNRTQAHPQTSFSKSGARLHAVDSPRTTFAEVAGYDGVKQEVSEVVQFLKEPDRFADAGARIPKGILLVGPPGTGKTLLARAVAGEAGVPFIAIAGSEFTELFVGVGAARVRDLFKQARAHEPSIVFIDEIDAIGRKRGAGIGGGNDEREQTLNQILSEMDGFEPAEGIVVLAATNRPDVLDPALLRAGRFDRQVVVPLPTLDERRAILAVHCRSKHLAKDADIGAIARMNPGMSGAELENLVNEAALRAVRDGRTEVSVADLDAAHDRVLLGVRRSSLVLTGDEQRIVAYHESGHALVAELLEHADPVRKVTILPSGLALGATQQLPVEERYLQQRPALEDSLAVRLGGRGAELAVFGMPSTGAQDDLASATELASRMVREWGMSDVLGAIAFGPRQPVFLGEDLVHAGEYSPETARIIDEEVARILGEQEARVRLLLTAHRAALDALAAALVERESLEGDDVRAILSANASRGRDLRPVPAGPCALPLPGPRGAA